MPRDIKAESGNVPVHGYGAGSGTITINVKQTDSQGHVTWEVVDAATGASGPRARRRGLDVLLEKKRLVITGVLTPQSIAFAAARACQEQGAQIILTGFGRGMSITQKVAKRLPTRRTSSRWT